MITDMIFLLAVWTPILTAPIHCRGSIDVQEMLKVMMKCIMRWQYCMNLYGNVCIKNKSDHQWGIIR